MKLHRSSELSDWKKIDIKGHNIWQRLAATTSGLITPGNIITLAGFVIVIYGLQAILRADYAVGLGALVIGRLLDLADGMAAEATGTKSPLGESLDASVDKIVTVLTVGVLLVGDLAPVWVILALIVPHLAIAAMVLFLRLKKRRLHPSALGKISMALAWLGIAGLLALKLLPPDAEAFAIFPVYGLVIVSAALGFWTAASYARQR